MAQIGAVYINAIEADQPRRSATATKYAVDEGSPVSDHVSVDNKTININGYITGPDASTRLKRLEAYFDNGTQVTYINRVKAVGVVIVKYDSDHVLRVGNGFQFTMTLQHIRIANASVIKEMDYPIRTKVKAKTKKGKQQTKKKKDVKKDNKKKSDKNGVYYSGKGAVGSKEKGYTPAQAASRNGNYIYGK